jgi:hypothetical protein
MGSQSGRVDARGHQPERGDASRNSAADESFGHRPPPWRAASHRELWHYVRQQQSVASCTKTGSGRGAAATGTLLEELIG